MKKEKLNEKDLKKVAGGTTLSCDDPTKGAYIQSNGGVLDVHCDFCGERISGWPKPVYVDFSDGGLELKVYCLRCALKLNQYIKTHGEIQPFNIELDINPDFDPSK